MMYASTLEDLIFKMKNTKQFENMDVLQHGESVHSAYLELISELENGNHQISDLYFKLKNKLLDIDTMERYHIYHDCGKPFCQDDAGRFPNHAMHSCNQWKLLFPDDVIVQELMKHDMDFHIMRGDDIMNLWQNPLAPSLYLTAWAELEANAVMFGGRNSDSYKIKRKRLIQAGKKYDSHP